MSAATEVVQLAAAPPVVIPAAEVSPLTLLHEAVSKGLDANQLHRLTDLYERWKERAAREAYLKAMAAFRAEVRPILKDKPVGYDSTKPGGGRTDYKYATLATIDALITPILSKHGLTASWKTVEQVKDWIKIRCTISHIEGHQEACELGAPPDKTGGKNDVQAIGSTQSYLQRYTLIAACGLATREQDDDGNGGEAATPGKLVRDALSPLLKQSPNDPTAHVIWKVGNAALKALGETAIVDSFRDEAVAVRTALRDKGSQGADGGRA